VPVWRWDALPPNVRSFPQQNHNFWGSQLSFWFHVSTWPAGRLCTVRHGGNQRISCSGMRECAAAGGGEGQACDDAPFID
jgi:hypothetical protein